MDDSNPVNLDVQEMEVPSNGSENSEESAPESPSPLGSQALPPIRQGASENQDLPSEFLAGPSSRSSVPAAASSSQDPNIDQLAETTSANQQHQGSSSMQDFEDSDSSSPKANLGGRLGDAGVLEARDESHRSRSIASSSGSQPIGSDMENLERISVVQERILEVLSEIHDAFEIEGGVGLIKFLDIFHSFSAKPITPKTSEELSIKLRHCLKEWRENWDRLQWEYLKPAGEAISLFIRVVVQTLVSTVMLKGSRSRLNLYSIMLNYENFKRCGERFLALQRYRIRSASAADADAGKRLRLKTLETFQYVIPTYSPLVQSVLSDLLKYIAGVDASVVYPFVNILFDEDKSFLNEHYPNIIRP